MSAAPRPLRLLECCLYAQNLDAAADFYQRVLGLSPVSRAAGRHVFFRVGEAMLLLFQPERTAESEDVPPHGTSGPGHVAFAVDSEALTSWKLRLIDQEIAIEREIDWPGGGHSIYIRDPAGNSVELATPNIWPLDNHPLSSS